MPDVGSSNRVNPSSMTEPDCSSNTNLADSENSQDSSNGCGFCYIGKMFRCLKRKLSKKKTRSKIAKKTKSNDSPKPEENDIIPTPDEQCIEHVHVVKPSDLHEVPQNTFNFHSLGQHFDWNLFNQVGSGYVAVEEHCTETEPRNRKNKSRNSKNRKRKNRECNNNQHKDVKKPLEIGQHFDWNLFNQVGSGYVAVEEHCTETEPRNQKNKSRNSKNRKRKNRECNNNQHKDVKKPLEILLNPKLEKYWKNRYRLFSKYDEGISLDEESWYSVTPEKVSQEIALRCQCDVIIDGFCGAGGNTIQFAFTCERVIAIDIDENKISLAKHNAEIYGVADRIEFIVGDFFKVVPSLKADVVFLSPPWGGPEYTKVSDYSLNRIEPRGGKELFDVAKQVTDHIAYYLPRNINKTEIACLANDYVKIDSHYLNNRVIAVTAYFGDLAEVYEDEDF